MSLVSAKACRSARPGSVQLQPPTRIIGRAAAFRRASASSTCRPVETPPRRWADKEPPYDYLRLAAIVEFGLNEAKSHLEDDIARLTHDEANVGKAFAVHLYRLSTPGKMFSSRDWSSESKRICSVQEVKELVGDKNVTVYCGMWDATGKHKKGLWRIDTLGVSQVVQH